MRQQEAAEGQLELPLSQDRKLEIAALLKIRDPPVISAKRQKGLVAWLVAMAKNSDGDGCYRRGQEVMAAKLDISQRCLRNWRQDFSDLQILFSEDPSGPGENGVDRVDWFAVERLTRRVGGELSPAGVEHAGAADAGNLGRDVANNLLNGEDRQNCRSDRQICRSLPLPLFSNENTTLTITKTIDGQRTLVAQRPANLPGRPALFFMLSIDDLSNPDRIDEWFQWAVATGRAFTEDKHRIFAAAHSVFRRHNEAKRSNREAPGPAAFAVNVRDRRWFAGLIDDDWASQALRYLDRQESEL
jgi:hypothetical protein